MQTVNGNPEADRIKGFACGFNCGGTAERDFNRLTFQLTVLSVTLQATSVSVDIEAPWTGYSVLHAHFLKTYSWSVEDGHILFRLGTNK